MNRENRNAFIASAAIMAAIFGGMLAMPKIMPYVARFGPVGGIAVSFAFMAALFVVLWLRGRYQSRHRDERESGE
ncbi:MAG TPA: hypothetical protein VKN63_02035 [Afifellaceae bacterium]|nr:hypothetical protein [Afifellaceae bacterium]